MANLDNPAGRLLHWLDLGRKRPHDHSAMGEWCVVFGLDHDQVANRSECSRRGMLLARLARDVRREAALLPPNLHPELLLSRFQQVETTLDQFTILPSITIGTMFEPMSGEAWMGLEMLDAMLSSHRPDTLVEPTDVQNHLQSVRDLIDEVLADDELADDLTRYIVARLREIEDALTDALITGASGLELAVNAALGAARREPDWWDRIGQTRWGPRIGKIWMAIVLSLGAAGSVAVLMPGEDTPPSIEHPVQVDVDVDDEIHDAEIVENDRP